MMHRTHPKNVARWRWKMDVDTLPLVDLFANVVTTSLLALKAVTIQMLMSTKLSKPVKPVYPMKRLRLSSEIFH